MTMAMGGMTWKNLNRYVFKKDRMVRLGVFYSREFGGWEWEQTWKASDVLNRLPLQRYCDHLVVSVLADITVNVRLPRGRERQHHIFASVAWSWTLAFPISLPSIPSRVRRLVVCNQRLPVSFASCIFSSLLHSVNCFLFCFLFPQQLCYNPLRSFWLQLPKHVAAHGHNLQCRCTCMWGDAHGVSVLWILVREWMWQKEISCLFSDILRQVMEGTCHLYCAFLPSLT